MSTGHSVLVLVNPKARGGHAGEHWPELEKSVFDRLGDPAASVRRAFTSAEDHGAGVVRQALKDGIRKILVVGGDGTISEAIQGFFEHGKPVAPDALLMVMPAGRGDDFLKTLLGHRFFGAAEGWEQALHLLSNGKPRACDVGKINWVTRDGLQAGSEKYFINIASFGFAGLIVQRVTENSARHGKTGASRSAWTYLAHSVSTSSEYRPLDLTVRVDGREAYSGLLQTGSILNGKYNGGGVCWGRETRVDDGFFDLVLSEPAGLGKMIFSAVPRMISGNWVGAPGVILARGKKVEVRERPGSQRKHCLFEVDGDLPEPSGCVGADLQIIEGAIRILA